MFGLGIPEIAVILVVVIALFFLYFSKKNKPAPTVEASKSTNTK